VYLIQSHILEAKNLSLSEQIIYWSISIVKEHLPLYSSERSDINLKLSS